MKNPPLVLGNCESYSSELFTNKNRKDDLFKPPLIQTVSSANIELNLFSYQDLCILKETLDFNLKRLSQISGQYILIIAPYMRHFGHCIVDILPAFEYIREIYKNTTFKFLLPKMSPIKSILLALDPDFWADKIEVYNTHNGKAGLKLEGDIKIYLLDRYTHRSKGGSIDLIERIKRQNSKKLDLNDLIFCPRLEGSSNGRIQNTEEVDLISKTIRNFIKDNKLQLNFKIFNPLLNDGSYMSIQDQRLFFKNAHTVLGPRGSAIHNIIWSKRFTDKNFKPLNVIEITQCLKKLQNLGVKCKDHRAKLMDIGSWNHYPEDFNSQYYHIFYKIKSLEDQYIYTEPKDIILALKKALESP